MNLWGVLLIFLLCGGCIGGSDGTGKTTKPTYTNPPILYTDGDGLYDDTEGGKYGTDPFEACSNVNIEYHVKVDRQTEDKLHVLLNILDVGDDVYLGRYLSRNPIWSNNPEVTNLRVNTGRLENRSSSPWSSITTGGTVTYLIPSEGRISLEYDVEIRDYGTGFWCINDIEDIGIPIGGIGKDRCYLINPSNIVYLYNPDDLYFVHSGELIQSGVYDEIRGLNNSLIAFMENAPLSYSDEDVSPLLLHCDIVYAGFVSPGYDITSEIIDGTKVYMLFPKDYDSQARLGWEEMTVGLPYMIKYLTQVFNTSFPEIAIRIGEFSSPNTVSRARSSHANTLNSGCLVYLAVLDDYTIAHELTHIYSDVKGITPEWILEGLPTYLGRYVMTNFSMSSYFTKPSSLVKADLEAYENGIDKPIVNFTYDDGRSVYDWGARYFRFLDMLIQHETDNTKTIEDVLRYIYTTDEEDFSYLGTYPLLYGINNVTQKDFTPIFNKYIFDNQKLPVKNESGVLLLDEERLDSLDELNQSNS